MHKYTAGLLAGLSLAFAPAPLPKPDTNKTELKKLQGEWVQLSVSIGGRMTPPTAATTVIAITGYQLQYRTGGKTTEWALTIDAKKKPRVFDIRGVSDSTKKYTYRGVYRLEGDTLTVCSQMGEAESVRPTNFDGVKPGVYLEVFRRVKR